jgi:hypothetical protein
VTITHRSYIWEKKSNFLVAEVHFLEEEVQVQKAEIFLAF